jgi:hypothetical protein
MIPRSTRYCRTLDCALPDKGPCVNSGLSCRSIGQAGTGLVHGRRAEPEHWPRVKKADSHWWALAGVADFNRSRAIVESQLNQVPRSDPSSKSRLARSASPLFLSWPTHVVGFAERVAERRPRVRTLTNPRRTSLRSWQTRDAYSPRRPRCELSRDRSETRTTMKGGRRLSSPSRWTSV